MTMAWSGLVVVLVWLLFLVVDLPGFDGFLRVGII